MSQSITLTQLEFRRLYTLLQKLVEDASIEAGRTPPETKERILGYVKNPNEKDISAVTLIRGSEEVKKYLGSRNKTIEHFSINQFYKATLLLGKDEPVRLSGIYADVFFLLFPGCRNKEDFFRKHPTLKVPVNYKVFYYSALNQKVKDFDLTIQETFDGETNVSIMGFHNATGIKLEASLSSRGDSWLISTEAERSSKKEDALFYLNMGIHKGSHLIEDPDLLSKANFLKGIIHSINESGYPIAVECFLVRENIDGFETAVLNISKYLNLVRNNFLVRMEEDLQPDTENIDKLKVHGFDISSLQHLADKTFRILTYDPLWDNIIQSKLYIGNAFTGVLTDLQKVEEKSGSQKAEKKQRYQEVEHVCHISINNYLTTKLVIEIAENNGQDMSTTTVLEVPDDAGQVIHGAYCTSGKRTIKPEGGLLVMQEADKSIKPGHFRRKEMYKQQPGTEALVDELLQVHKIATKKPARKPNRSERRSR